MANDEAPIMPSPRFIQELEFVLALANPTYLQHLAVNMPHIFNPSQQEEDPKTSDSEAAKFARYLSYLQKYWSTPEYSQYLTHPAATLRHLELLQNEQFRRDLIRPDLLLALSEGFKGAAQYQRPQDRVDATANGIDPVNGIEHSIEAGPSQSTVPPSTNG